MGHHGGLVADNVVGGEGVDGGRDCCCYGASHGVCMNGRLQGAEAQRVVAVDGGVVVVGDAGGHADDDRTDVWLVLFFAIAFLGGSVLALRQVCVFLFLFLGWLVFFLGCFLLHTVTNKPIIMLIIISIYFK